MKWPAAGPGRARPARSARSRLRAFLIPAALVAAAAAGCGVQPSEVVQAGEPATGMAPAIQVFFYDRYADRTDGADSADSTGGAGSARGTGASGGVGGTDSTGSTGAAGSVGAADASGGGSATPVPGGALVAAPRAGGPSVAAAVRAVFAGPDAAEAAVLTTELPRLPSAPTVRTGGGLVLVTLPDGVAPLTPPACARWCARPPPHCARCRTRRDRRAPARQPSQVPRPRTP